MKKAWMFLALVLGCVMALSTAVAGNARLTLTMVSPPAGPIAGLTSLFVAADADDLKDVQFTLNGMPFGPVLTANPCRYVWDATQVASGSYDLGAVGHDLNGATVTASPVTVTVSTVTAPAPQAFAVARPAANAVFPAPYDVTVNFPAGTTAFRAELFNASNASVFWVVKSGLTGTQISFQIPEVGTLPSGTYLLAIKTSANQPAPYAASVSVVVQHAVPTPSPTPTPTPTPVPPDQLIVKLDQIQLTADQIKSFLVTPPVPSYGCSLTTSLFRYLDGRVRVTCAVSGLDAIALGWINGQGNFTIAAGASIQVKK